MVILQPQWRSRLFVTKTAPVLGACVSKWKTLRGGRGERVMAGGLARSTNTEQTPSTITGVVFDVDVGATLDQFLHLLHVASYGGHVQRRLTAFVPLAQLLVSRCPASNGLRRQRSHCTRHAVRLCVYIKISLKQQLMYQKTSQLGRHWPC